MERVLLVAAAACAVAAGFVLALIAVEHAVRWRRFRAWLDDDSDLGATGPAEDIDRVDDVPDADPTT